MYDPTSGRFMQRDTVRGAPITPVSLNRYIYVLNAPANNADPSGLDPNLHPELCGGYSGGNTADFASAVENLAFEFGRLGPSGKDSFVRQIGWCFAGISREGDINTALALAGVPHAIGGPLHLLGPHIAFGQDDLLPTLQSGGDDDQTHHWAAFFVLAYAGRIELSEIRAWVDTDPGDTALGLIGAQHGARFRGRVTLPSLADWIREDLIVR